MIDDVAIKKIDTQDMAGAYSHWPKMAKDAYGSANTSIRDMKMDHIVFAGMGGSGTMGDIFESILSNTNVHVDVVKGYRLPKTAGPETLVVTTSISGNTTETLHVLDAAVNAKCQTISFSAGGLIKDYCTSKNLDYRLVPMQHSPRASLPIFLYSMLSVLQNNIPVPESDIVESISLLAEIAPSITDPARGSENPSLALAEWIPDVPIIYYPWGLHAAAIRFKNSLQENAKTHAMAEDVMEACHNGMVSWIRDSIVRPILVYGTGDYIKTKERWTILEDFFRHNGISYRVVKSPGSSILERLMSLIYILDYASIYRSVILGVDPTPVAPIDYIKSKLKD